MVLPPVDFCRDLGAILVYSVAVWNSGVEDDMPQQNVAQLSLDHCGFS